MSDCVTKIYIVKTHLEGDRMDSFQVKLLHRRDIVRRRINNSGSLLGPGGGPLLGLKQVQFLRRWLWR